MRLATMIDNICKLSYTDEQLVSLIEGGELDEHFQNITEAQAWLGRVRRVYAYADGIQTARDRLEELSDQLIQFYVSYFESREFIGNQAAFDNPRYLIVLGGGTRAMQHRVEKLAELARTRESAAIVLSGGGFGKNTTEAFDMAGLLNNAKLAGERRILREEDSLDTVGNAVFVKLLLRLESLLDKGQNVCVVTSRFHAARSFNIFRQVFGPDYGLAVVGTQTVFDNASELKRAAHELRTDSVSSGSIFRVPDFTTALPDDSLALNPGDEQAFFMQMLLEHGLYKNRYDLLRKYRDVIRD